METVDKPTVDHSVDWGKVEQEYNARILPGVQGKKGSAEYERNYASTVSHIQSEINKLKKENTYAEQAINNAKTQEEFRQAVWNYKDTPIGKKYFEQTAGSNVTSAIQQANKMQARGMGGSEINRQLHSAEFFYKGGTSESWNKIIKEEDQNLKLAKMQSAGLRASGNAQIQTAQNKEMARLGGGTLVSSNVTTSRTNAIALGTAEKAQDFPDSFKSKQELEKQQINENQNTLNSLGLSIDVKDLNQKGISSLYTQADLQQTSMQTSMQGQRVDKIKVTTPDGKQRIFTNYDNAEKFIQRVNGRYQVEVQGPVQPNPFYNNLPYNFAEISNPVIPPTLTQMAQPKPMQDYPRSYHWQNLNIGEIARGAWEGGIMPLTQVILAPKPIFSDIFGRTEAEEKHLKKSVELVKQIAPDKPTAAGSLIQQIKEGKPITGTGEGLSYDVGSAAFDVGSAIIPTSKAGLVKIVNPSAKMTIPIVKQTIIGAPVIEMKTVATGVTIGNKGTTLLSKTESSGWHLGKPPVQDLKLESLAPEIGSRGFQLSTKEPFVQKIISSDEAIDAIGAKLGKDTAKTLMELSADMPKAPSPVVRDLPEGSVTSFTPTEHKTLIGVLTNPLKKVQFKGGISQIITVEKGRGVTSDVDAYIGPLGKTQKLAKEAQEYLNVPGRLDEGRTAELTSSGTKVEIAGNKAIELLTEKETIDASTIGKEANTFFGAKPNSKGIKSNEGIRVDSLGTQTIHKGMSVATLQGTTTKNLSVIPYLKKALPDRYIGAVDFRLVKDTSDLIDNLTQIGVNYQKKGNKELAEKFIGGAKTIRKEWDEYIDFDKFKEDAAKGLVESDKTVGVVAESKLTSLSKLTDRTMIQSAPIKSTSLTSSQQRTEKSMINSAIKNTSTIITESKLPSASSSIPIKSTSSNVSRIVSSSNAPGNVSHIVSSSKSSSNVSRIVSSSNAPSSSASIKSSSSITATKKSSSVLTKSSSSDSLVPTSIGITGLTSKSSFVKPSAAASGKVVYYTAKKKMLAIPKIPWDAKKPNPQPRKNKPREDFLGNTRVAEVEGFRTKKSDITYGKKTASLFAMDLKKTMKKSKIKLL